MILATLVDPPGPLRWLYQAACMNQRFEEKRVRELLTLADHGDGASSTPQDPADSTLRVLGHVAEYFVVLAIY